MWDKSAAGGNTPIKNITTATGTAANAAITHTITPDTTSPAGRVILHGMQWSTNQTAIGTTFSITIGDGVKTFGPMQIIAGGPGALNFVKPFTTGSVVTGTMTASGGGIQMFALDYEIVKD